MSGTGRDQYTAVAGSVPFDNSTNGFASEDVQAAIEEVNNEILTSASPGFSYGRTGVCSGGTYLQCETVPSNVSGRWVYINSAEVKRVFVSNELSTTYTLDITYHDGNGVGEILLGSVTVTAAKGNGFSVSWPVPTNKQIAVRVAATTANSPKNIVVGLELRGVE
jgi:hypothetical protein